MTSILGPRHAFGHALHPRQQPASRHSWQLQHGAMPSELMQSVLPHLLLPGRRAFTWAAKCGEEQLPAFPEPLHRALPVHCGGVSTRASSLFWDCHVRPPWDCLHRAGCLY